MIFLPTIQAYIFNLVVGVTPKHVKLGIVNDEIDFLKCNHLAYDGCFLDNQNVSLSCLFLEYMQNKTYDFVSMIFFRSSKSKKLRVYMYLYRAKHVDFSWENSMLLCEKNRVKILPFHNTKR